MWLKLQWARFFTLAGWDWRLSSRRGFDFAVTFPCGHSECSGSHMILVRVVDKTAEALARKHRETFGETAYDSPNPALFGDGPANTFWVMIHGAGGGDESVLAWIDGAQRMWERAAHE
ncbi:hypothetical protein [Terriglobus aquaticus]|uniref:YjbR protein n=1 Tax=Terriglobus aquaticus TaxID=940139 RepID=A0ABW9KI47_9BACT|nr:hypothetical protein [Terriglobus aquaticus]